MKFVKEGLRTSRGDSLRFPGGVHNARTKRASKSPRIAKMEKLTEIKRKFERTSGLKFKEM